MATANWLSGGHPLDEDNRLAARALGLLFLAGATIGLVSLQFPHPREADLLGLYSNVGLACLGALVLLVGAGRFRAWMLQVALALGALLITRAVLLSGESSSFYSVWFIWVDLFAFCFFSRRAAVGHVAFVAALYAVTLIVHPPTSVVASWLTTVATLIVAGVFIDTLVARARRQASDAAATATTLGQVTELGHELAALSDPGAVRLAVCQGSVRITGACRGFLWEPTGQGGPFQVTSGAGGPAQDRVPFGGPSAAVTEAFHTGRPVTRRAPALASERARTAGDQPCVAWLWHPIVHERRTMAVLELSWDDPARLDDPSVTTLVNLLSVDFAVNLQRIELLRELEATARTDELTALPNRRAWQEQLPRELRRSTRREEPLSVAMLDLDHFKRYNDTRGHQTGDELLMQVAARWSLELRPTDILARYGGEEFALALPACPLDEALEVVERLRAAMPDGQSCSAGVACWDGSETVTALLDRADRALYRAKGTGRNRSAVADGPALTEFTAAG